MKTTFKIIFTLVIFAMVTLFAVSCGGGDFAAGDGAYSENGASSGMTGGSTNDSEILVTEDRKIIKTVRESIQTDKYDDFMSSLNSAISELGGYVTSANHSGDSYYNEESLRYSSLTVRIPAEKLDEFTKRIDSLAIVSSYNEYIDDVTSSYVDVESRISVLEAEETALLQMLSKADTVSTTLEIRKSLNSVQSDLASLRAQKKNYDSLIAYSTVHMNVSEVRRAESANPGFFEEVGGVFSDSLYDIGRGLRDFAVWFLGNIIYILIFAAVVTGVVCLIIRCKKIRAANRAQKEESKTDAEGKG